MIAADLFHLRGGIEIFPLILSECITYIIQNPALLGGFHAHRDLKQIAICVKGSCKFIIDNGRSREEVTLDSPLKGILIESMQWREMHDFSADCVLMVLASELYDEADYIRDYDTFLSEALRNDSSAK